MGLCLQTGRAVTTGSGHQKAKAESENGPGEREIDIPQELQRRQARLSKIGKIKAEIEQRAQARYELEIAEYESKLVEREAKEKARGRKLGGRPPIAPQPSPQTKDQMNFTDSESRIMPISGGGFSRCL